MCLSKRERNRGGKLLFNICNTSSNWTLLWQTDTWETLLFYFHYHFVYKYKDCLFKNIFFGLSIVQVHNNKASSDLLLNICTGQNVTTSVTTPVRQDPFNTKTWSKWKVPSSTTVIFFFKEIQQENIHRTRRKLRQENAEMDGDGKQ